MQRQRFPRHAAGHPAPLSNRLLAPTTHAWPSIPDGWDWAAPALTHAGVT